MRFVAKIVIMPLKALLDPQGEAVKKGVLKLGFKGVDSVRVGKHIEVEIEAKDKDFAEKQIDSICQKLLSNPISESYQFRINKI